jgi:serine/threonine protein kinase
MKFNFKTHFFSENVMPCYLLENWSKLNRLGKGTYGSVYKYKKGEEYVAVKQCTFLNAQEEGVSFSILREILALQTLKHPNILPLLHVELNLRTASLVLPYRSQDLHQYLQSELSGEPFSALEIKNIMKQLLLATEYMHQQQILHRDFKPANILVEIASPSRNGEREIVVQIADFGLSRTIAQHKRNDYQYSTDVFTRWYRAPEILLGGKYSFSSDIWALGCIMAELMRSGNALFPGKSNYEQILSIFRVFGRPSWTNWPEGMALPHFKSTQFPDWCKGTLHKTMSAAKAKDPIQLHFLTQLLQMDPKKRFTASQALNHFYFKQ